MIMPNQPNHPGAISTQSPSTRRSPHAMKRAREDTDRKHETARKRKKMERARKVRSGEVDLDLDSECVMNIAIGRMDKCLLADYVAQRTKRFQSNLSPVELEDLYIPGVPIHKLPLA